MWACPGSCFLAAADAATWLCAHGASVHACKADSWNDTALHYAAARGHADIAKLLLAFGADGSRHNFAGGLLAT